MTDNLPARSDLVLVAFIPKPRDMEIARLLGWYRIPLRSAPKVVAVDWLAFYQPASFGKEHKWQIEWFAPVRGHELTTRLDLFKDEPDHPHAREEYFKIQIGPLAALPEPILAGKWKRLTFLYTTGEHLMQAEQVNDLTVRDDERVVLWQALRERALERQKYEVQDWPEELPVDLDTLAFLNLMAGGNPFGEE